MTTTKEETKIVIDENQFKVLYTLLKTMSTTHRNIFIKDGKLIQFNDSRTVIFSVDLTNILGTRTFVIPLVAKKLELLKTFVKCGNIAIDTIGDRYLFSDGTTILAIKKGDEIHSTGSNLLVTPEELHSKYVNIDSEKVVAKKTIDSDLIVRINSFVKSMDTTNITVILKDKKLKVRATPTADESSLIADFFSLEANIDKSHEKGIRGFFSNHQINTASKEMNLEFYYVKDNVNKLLMKTEQTIVEGKKEEDKKSINVITWQMANLKDL